MLGAIVLVVIIVYVLPSATLIGSGIAAAVLGFFLKDDAEQRHQGSELLDLNT